LPLYNNTFPPYAVAFGDDATLVNAETLGAGNRSQRVAIADKSGVGPRPVTITFAYAVAPSSVQYDIYAAFDDTPLAYGKIGSTTNVNGDQVTIQRAAAGGPNFRFILVQEVITPNQNATVKARQ
jgi:hypothetical protein